MPRSKIVATVATGLDCTISHRIKYPADISTIIPGTVTRGLTQRQLKSNPNITKSGSHGCQAGRTGLENDSAVVLDAYSRQKVAQWAIAKHELVTSQQCQLGLKDGYKI